MSLRTKTALIVSLLVVLFFTVSGLLFVRFFENSLKKSICEELKAISLAKAQFISAFLNDSLRDAQAIASFLPARALEEKDLPRIEGHLKTFFNTHPKFENGIFILDEKGDLWADYPAYPEARGKNYSHREYFQTTMEKQKGIIGVPYRSARTGEPVATFTALLKGTRGQTLGLVGCSVRLSHIDAFGGIRKLRIGETGYLYILDPSGRILIHPEDEKVFQVASPVPVLIPSDAFCAEPGGVEEAIDLEGVPVVRSIRRIPETDWILVVQQDRSEAFAPIRKARTRVFVYTLVIIALSVLISNLAIQKITDPLKKLRHLVQELGEEGLGVKDEFKTLSASLSSSSDEISDLVRAFSEMAGRLDQSHLSLKNALEEWERTFNAVYDQIFILDRESRIVRMNQAASELIGLSPEKAIGQPCYRLLHGTDHPPSDCPHQRSLATGEVAALEVEEPYLKGFFEVTTVPLRDETGNLTGTVHVMRNITGRKLAELKLRESEERYRTLVESATDVIFTLSPEGLITSLNPAFETIVGWQREDWIGKNYLPILHPEDQGRAIELFGRVLKGEKLPSFELRILHPSGGYIILEITVVPLFEGETIKAILGIARDVTQRKEKEEALRISQEKFSKTFRATPVWLTLSSLEEGRYYEANEAFYRGTGYSEEEVIGKTTLELGLWPTPEDRSAFVNELREKGFVKNREVKFRKKSGELMDALISAELVEISGSKYILKATLDLTDRKRAEESLRASEERYRSLVEYSSDAILLLDPQRRILSCNEAFSHLFGYGRDEIEGKSIRLLHPSEESFRSFGQLYYPVIHERGFVRSESELLRKNGEKVLVEGVTSAIRAPDGTITGYVVALRDISDKRRIEQEKAALEEQLRQSQKMEAIGILAGGVAHDFNNLLTVIQGNCELILFGLSEGHPLRRGIEQISGAAHRAADLTRQLLAFSRRQILEPKIIDLNEVVHHIEKMLKRIIGEDIRLETILAKDLGSVRADPSQIEQVIFNLAVNARDAMPNGGTLTVETSNVELDEHYAKTHLSVLPGPYVMLSIADTGIGMTPEVKERIFEPFFTTKEKGKGTGLGLSTVYGIVKQSNGYIWVYSEPGQGTTFKIYFPRVDEVPSEKVEKEGRLEIPRGTETILLVEDDEPVRMMTSRMLTQFGYRVLLSSDPLQAIQLFEKEIGSIDLILTDVVMPAMSGREMMKQIHLRHPGVKVLYMSGYTDNAIAHHGILDEGIDYIQKPFTLEGLLQKVRDVLDRPI